jgi:O-antigen/teichoic acid export membrane protein
MPLIKKLLSLIKNIHFQSLMANGLTSVFGMITTAMLFRALSLNDAGLYFFFMVLYNLVDTLKAGFLTNAFVSFYAGTSEERGKEIAGSCWTIVILMSIGLIILNIPSFFISGYISDTGTAMYLKYFSIFALTTVPSFMANIVVLGDMRFDRLFWLRLINQLLFIASIILLIVLKKSTIVTVLMAFAITNFLASIIIMLLGWTRITNIKYTNKSTLLELFHFGKYSVGTSLSSNLFPVTDTLFLNFFLGAPAVAIYNLGARWMPIVNIPILSFASSGTPMLASYYNNDQKDRMMHVMQKLIGMLSIVLFILAALAILFADPLVILLGGDKYIGSQAPNIFRIFISMAVLFPADRFFAITLDVIKKPKINFYKILIMLVINLVADFIGVSLFKSVYAVAITNIFPLLAAIIIAYVPLQNYYKFNFWNMYIIGYYEITILIKNAYQSFFKKGNVTNI